MNKLVIFWDRYSKCFIIQGERLEITLWDVYFMTSLPPLVVIGDISSKLSRGVLMDGLCVRNLDATTYVHASYILVHDIENLETRVVETLVLWLMGLKGPHRISGYQLVMVKSVVRGTYYGWA